MIRETENLKPSEMRAVIRQLDEDVNRLRADLDAEQRAHKFTMLSLWEDDPEKAADVREQKLAMLTGVAEPEPTLVLKPVNIAIGIGFALVGEYELAFAVLAFGGAQIENERHTTVSRYTVDCDAIIQRIKGFFNRG